MRTRALWVLASLAIALLLVLAAVPSPRTDAAVSLDADEQAFVQLINDYRQQNGRQPLTVIQTLQNAAEWMSQDMGEEAYFDHTDSLGRSPWTRMADFGYGYSTSKGENIAAGYTTAQSVFNGWKNSPGHNANMLNTNFRVMGIGRVYVSGSPYGYYWTNDFGGYVPPGPPESTPTPTSPPPTSTPAPSSTATPVPTAVPPPSATATPTPPATPTPTPVATPIPPPSPTPGSVTDLDGDGFANGVETLLGTNPTDRCGEPDMSKPTQPSRSWPADLSTTNGIGWIDIADLQSFITPVRHLNTSPGDAGFDARWDIVPGSGIFQKQINIVDLMALVQLRPMMFSGEGAFNGQTCSD